MDTTSMVRGFGSIVPCNYPLRKKNEVVSSHGQSVRQFLRKNSSPITIQINAPDCAAAAKLGTVDGPSARYPGTKLMRVENRAIIRTTAPYSSAAPHERSDNASG